MKRLCFFGIIFFNLYLSEAQHINELTKEVVLSFKKTHPNVKSVNWERIDSNLIALFIDKGYIVEITYTNSGNIIRTKVEMDPSYLPKSSSDYVARYFNKNNTYKAFKLFDDSSKISYLIEIDSTRLSFDTNGSFLKFESFKKLK